MCQTRWAGPIFAATFALFVANAPGSGLSQTPALGGAVEQPSFDATHLSEPIDVGGTWLVHAGDDPAYAQPQFDDSHWTPIDISKSLHPLFPGGNPGVVWYRLRLKVSPNQRGLAVWERNVSHAFVLYSGGVELLEAGKFAPYVEYVTYAPLIGRIPDAQTATGSVVLALRVHIDDREWKINNPGLYPGNIRIGHRDELFQQNWFRVMRPHGAECVDLFLVALLSLAGFVLYSAERDRKEYLWLSLYGLSSFFIQFSFLYGYFHDYPAWWWWLRAVPHVGVFWFQFPMYFAFVRQRMKPVFISVIFVCCLLAPIAFLPGLSSTLRSFLTVPANALAATVLPGLLIIHWRRGNREAALLLLPVLLSGAAILSEYVPLVILALGHPYTGSWATAPIAQIGGFDVAFFDITSFLFSLVFGLIILLRSNRMSREAAIHQGELAAAREVQQILLPAGIEATPGFAVDTAYLPAQQVGGDFFQIIPVEDNGILVVVGDVAGKGLPAAMMVSVLVGAIRTLAAFTQKPAEVLAQLNERLVGRSGGGFSTAIAAHIESNGSVHIANAGHLSPYLDGEELELPGALPLGIVSGTTYDTVKLQIDCGSRLTFYSDGVIEAQSAKGDLMGFERGRELSKLSADAIVAAAQKFGQSDDITVVGIMRK
jgi:hypothetical protein